MSEIPKCCGKKMIISLEGIKFIEARCESCGDMVYIKKEEAHKPQMLDD